MHLLLTLIDPNGYDAATAPQIATTPTDAARHTAWLRTHAAPQHAALINATTRHTVRAADYTIRTEPIHPDALADLIAHHADGYLNTLGGTPAYLHAMHGIPLAGLLGRPELRGEPLTTAAYTALGHHAAA
ncbi:hypothetical protein [Streptomyces zhihengii]